VIISKGIFLRQEYYLMYRATCCALGYWLMIVLPWAKMEVQKTRETKFLSIYCSWETRETWWRTTRM